jgi:hypothetical protein
MPMWRLNLYELAACYWRRNESAISHLIGFIFQPH